MKNIIYYNFKINNKIKKLIESYKNLKYQKIIFKKNKKNKDLIILKTH